MTGSLAKSNFPFLLRCPRCEGCLLKAGLLHPAVDRQRERNHAKPGKLGNRGKNWGLRSRLVEAHQAHRVHMGSWRFRRFQCTRLQVPARLARPSMSRPACPRASDRRMYECMISHMPSALTESGIHTPTTEGTEDRHFIWDLKAMSCPRLRLDTPGRRHGHVAASACGVICGEKERHTRRAPSRGWSLWNDLGQALRRSRART